MRGSFCGAVERATLAQIRTKTSTASAAHLNDHAAKGSHADFREEVRDYEQHAQDGLELRRQARKRRENDAELPASTRRWHHAVFSATKHT